MLTAICFDLYDAFVGNRSSFFYVGVKVSIVRVKIEILFFLKKNSYVRRMFTSTDVRKEVFIGSLW